MKQRKRILALLPAAALVLGLLAGCQAGQTPPDPAVSGGEEEFAPSCLALLTAVWGGELPAGENREVYDGSDPETLNTYIQGAYGLNEDEWADAAVARETGMSARETGVLRFADEDAARHGEEALQDYLRTREGDFTGYAPEQAALAADGIVCREGSYVGLFIHEGAADLRSAFLTALETGELPEPPAPSAEPVRDFSAAELADAVWYALLEATGRGRPSYDVSSSDYYRTQVLGLSPDDCDDLAVLGGDDQIIILRCVDEEAALRVEEHLQPQPSPIPEQLPAQSSIAVRRQGRYVGYFYHPDADRAGELFLDALAGDVAVPCLAVVGSDPAFPLQDLLLRLLVEGGVCPGWADVKTKAWTDTRSDNGQTLKNVAALYGAAPAQYESCAFAYWDPDSEEDYTSPFDAPCHLALFQTGGEEQAKALLPALERGLDSRRDSLKEELARPMVFSGTEENVADMVQAHTDLLTRQLDALDSAVVLRAGRYAAVVICSDPAQATVALPRFAASADTRDFYRNFYSGSQSAAPENVDPNYPDRELYTPPNDEDMTIYDTSAILAAWAQKDPAGLSEYDRDIYDAAQALLAKLIKDGMTELEKETAVYTWLVNNVDYDSSHMDVMEETSRDAYGPYGGLVDRSAVCLGYATTFQLLMDMAGVECVTVVGAGSHSTAAHAWNVVKPDGNWYCVDVTWDANGREQLGSGYEWRYFNITSDQMAKNHQWDYANVPEAVTAP